VRFVSETLYVLEGKTEHGFEEVLRAKDVPANPSWIFRPWIPQIVIVGVDRLKDSRTEGRRFPSFRRRFGRTPSVLM
jgi:hypothetical protein